MKPFLTDRPRVSAPGTPPLAAGTGFASAGALPHSKGHSAEHAGGAAPQIECVREGDRITRLIVVCGCGERIEIDCLYAQGK
jgi:hypothetical protein